MFRAIAVCGLMLAAIPANPATASASPALRVPQLALAGAVSGVEMINNGAGVAVPCLPVPPPQRNDAGALVYGVLAERREFANHYGVSPSGTGQAWTRSGLPCERGFAVSFNGDGKLESCTLSRNYQSQNHYPGPSTVHFTSSQGTLLALATRTGRVSLCKLASALGSIPAGTTVSFDARGTPIASFSTMVFPGKRWRIAETNPQGQGCRGTWTRRGESAVFDAEWQCLGGKVTDVVEVGELDGDDVVVFRRGMKDSYVLTLSADRRTIVSGRINWAPDWSFTGEIE